MRASRGAVALLIAALAPWACTDATDVELLEIGSSGLLFGVVYLDLDGSGGLSAADSIVEGAEVVLLTVSGADVVQRATSDSLGVFALPDVPLGSYRLSLAPVVLGDSLEVIGAATQIDITVGDTTQVNVGAGFGVYTLEEVLTAPLGRRLFTSGVALNSRVNFGDGQVHFKGEATFLRALNVERSPLAPGDSVRILGRRTADNGRPALTNVRPFVLVPQAALVSPVELSTASAAAASGGLHDAALVRIRNAEITDTSTNVSGNFRFWADDGTDSVEVVLRAFLGLNHAAFRPDTVIRISRMTGLLAPFDDGSGTLRWRVLPRDGNDIVLETKLADVGIAVSLDTTRASLGDTVEVRVVATNAGPLPATSMQVRDTVPTGMTFVSSTATVGSYQAGTGIWTIGNLAAGAADTLWVRMEVTNGTPRSLNVIAQVLALTREVDPNGFNNGAVVVLTIQ